jgi:hypothetical protein
MSYILEALKKFEQKREQEDLSKAMSFLGGPGPIPRKRLRWPYLLVAALFLNAVIMLWWIAPWRSEKKEAPVISAKSQPTNVNEPKVIEQNPIRGTGTVRDANLPVERLIPPIPPVEKPLPSITSSVSGKTREVDRINGVIPLPESEPASSAPHSIKKNLTRSIPNKSEAPVEKKAVYFKDGKKEFCDAIRLTENFLHCTNAEGGALINLNKIDLEKTLPGREP